MRRKRFLIVALVLALVRVWLPVQPAYADTIVVDTTSDVLDAAGTCGTVTVASLPGADGDISLREAICAANNNPGPDTINFNIPGAGVQTIQPTIALPILTDDDTTINGYSQPGTSPASTGSPATLLIEIDGTNVTNNNGLNITSANNVIQGLVINRFSWNGVAIGDSAATGNIISGNHIGTDANGTIDQGNGFDGVFIGLGAQNNVVGGDEPSERNVISGNDWEGVAIHGSGTMSNTVSGNYIGTKADGLGDLGNTLGGIRIYGGAQNNTAGGNTEGARNIISGNDGVDIIIHGSGTMSNTVSGNYIGIAANGTDALGDLAGVYILDGARNNTIGSANVISGNDREGVRISGSDTEGNTVSGNYIGTDASGTNVLHNRLGVYIVDGAQNNTIGPGNVISGNDEGGVAIEGSDTMSNTVIGNYIGTDTSGSGALSNKGAGIYITSGAQNNTVGGDTAGERNVISGNVGYGVVIYGTDTMSNTVSGNYIGTKASGIAALGNTLYGVYIYDGAQNNTIGGDTAGERNVISGNVGNGISISGSDTVDNIVSGNYIGTDASGSAVLSNSGDGVNLTAGTRNNTIGPGNVIAHNGDDGVAVNTFSTVDNTITQNSIFANDMGIVLTGGANGGIAAPVIMTTTGGSVNIIGAACAGCTVEIFENSDTEGEGETYLGNTIATLSGAFTLTVSHLTKPYLTATATNAGKGTSQFSAVLTATVPLAPPTGPVYLPIVMKN